MPREVILTLGTLLMDVYITACILSILLLNDGEGLKTYSNPLIRGGRPREIWFERLLDASAFRCLLHLLLFDALQSQRRPPTRHDYRKGCAA